MNVSPDALRKEVVQTLNEINASIAEVKKTSLLRGTPPEKLVDHLGGYVMSPLLLAKAQCLNALALLNEQGKK
jgi:hypothetical protein